MTQYVPLTTADPGTFSYTEGQTLYNEKLAHEILKHAAAMADEGYEIAFDLPDTFDYSSLWTAQTASLSALSSALAVYANVPEFQTFYSQYAGQLGVLTTLPFSMENFAVRTAAIAAISAVIQSSSEGNLTLEIPQPLQIERIYPAFPLSLWSQQSAALQAQTEYIVQIKSNLQDKIAALPQQDSKSVITGFISSLLDNWAVEFFTAGLKYTLQALMGAGGAATAVMAFLCSIGFIALKDAWDRYTEGVKSCTAMESENIDMAALDITTDGQTDNQKAWEYYGLRETVITRHQRDIHNLLTEVIAMEARLSNSLGEPDSDNAALVAALKELNITEEISDLRGVIEDALEQLEGKTLDDLVEAVKDLGMEGYEIEAEDFKIRKLGRTLTTESW